MRAESLLSESRSAGCGRDAGDLFGALVRRRIRWDSDLYQSAGIELSLPDLDPTQQPDIFREESTSNGYWSDPLRAGELKLIAEPESLQPDAPALPQSDAGTPGVNQGDVQGDGRGSVLRRTARPYLSMASESEFTAGLYRLKASSRLVWSEKEVVRLVSLALRGVSSSIFDFDAPSPPLVLVLGYSISAVRRVLSEVYWAFLQRVLTAYALSALCASSDPALSALASAVRELVFLHDTTLMHTEDMTSASRTLVSVLSSSHLHRSFLAAVFQAVAPPDLAKGVKSKTLTPDRAYLKDSFWLERTRGSWELFASLFTLVERTRVVTFKPYKPTIFGSVRLDQTLDVPFLCLVVQAYALQRVASVLLIELQSQVFSLSLSSDESTDSVMQTAEEVWAKHGDNPIGQLKAMGWWARGRVHLLRGGAANEEILDFCRELNAPLSIPFREEDFEDMVSLARRCCSRYEILHAEVLYLVNLWQQDTLVFGDSLKKNQSYERDFKRFDLKKKVVVNPDSQYDGSIAPALLIDTHIEDRKSSMEEGRKEALLTSGSIIFRTVDRGLVEEARNEILQKHGQKMREAERRSFEIEWRLERLRSVHIRREQLAALLNRERLGWIGAMWGPGSQNSFGPLNVPASSQAPMKEEGFQLIMRTETPPTAADATPVRNSQVAVSLEDLDPVDVREGGSPLIPTRSPGVVPGLGSSVRLDHPEQSDAAPVRSPGDGDVFGPAAAVSSPFVATRDVKCLSPTSTADLPPFLSGPMAQAACYLLNQDVYDLEGDHALMMSLDSLRSAVHLLAIKAGVSGDPSLGNLSRGFDDLPDSASFENLTFLLRDCLSRAVYFQCRALDQALLLSAIRNGSLLRHLNRIEDTCLISPRSSFVSLLVSTVIETHMYRFPRCASINPQKLDRSHMAAQHRLVWTTRALDSALKKTKAALSMDANDYALMYAIDTSKISDSDLSSRKLFSVFSTFEIDFLYIEYSAPWPQSFIFSAKNMASIISCSKRMFRIKHALYISKLIWTDIKDFRTRIPKIRSTESDSLRSMVKNIYERYHRIHKTIQVLDDFFCERVLATQEDFKTKLIKSCPEGFAVIIRLFESYAIKLAMNTFSEAEYSGKGQER